MPIAPSDLLFRLSIKTGSAGNTTASAPATALGKYISTTAITDASLNNLFDTISGPENAASDVEYRCFFVLNNHATLTWQAPTVWISGETAGGASAAIGLDPAGVTPKGQAGAQAASIATEQDAPAGVTFSAPVSKGTGLVLPDIPAGSCAAIWVRRTAANTAALALDGVVISIEGDTAA